MNRIQAYLDNTTSNDLNNFAKENGVSVSNAAGTIVREYFQKRASKNMPIDEREMKSYFLRIMNTVNQVLMCVYDEQKSSLKSNSAEDCIAKIKAGIQKILDDQYQATLVRE